VGHQFLLTHSLLEIAYRLDEFVSAGLFVAKPTDTLQFCCLATPGAASHDLVSWW